MRLTEIVATKRGTYVGLRVLDPGTDMLRTFIHEHAIPYKMHDKERRKHVTLIYSRTHCPHIVRSKEVHRVKPVHFEVFSTQSGKRALVLLLSAPTVAARHRQLMSLHPLTYDFPHFKAHVTLSYDIGDFDHGALPPFKEDLFLGDEYIQELKP
mgnify:CR=1 FL=1